jgi:polysaccharide biosynthesis/export protein
MTLKVMTNNKLKSPMIAGAFLLIASQGWAQDKVVATNKNAAPVSSTKDAKVDSPAGKAASVSPDFVIGEGDVLAINVWREPEMSRTVPVRPDGRISLPLMGEFQASGLTPKELETKLTKQLATLVTNPEVTVIVQEIKSQKINIMGEIEKPGSYPLTKPMTVLDALSVAGGLKDFAKIKKIYVLRRNRDGSTQKLAFNYKKAIQGASQQNFELEERDTIVVP